MNKIENLIQQLCPKGVEFKELEELGYFFGGLTGKSKGDFQNGNAKFITYMNVFSNIAVKTVINTFVKVDVNENQKRIEFGDVLFTGSSETPDECGMSSVLTEKINEPLYLNSFCFGFRLHDKKLFLPDFLKYLFRDESIRTQIGQTASGVTRFNISKKRFAKVTIPIPPLPIQQEIVKILDSFTELETELKTELEAELEARKKQYEFYRDELLNFEGKDVEWIEIENVFDLRNGYTPSKSNPKYWIRGTVPWFRVEDIRANGRILNDSIQHINIEAVKGNRFFSANSIIVSTSATIGEHALITEDFLSNQRFTCLTCKPKYKEKLNMYFFQYYMYIVDEWCKKNINVSGFAGVDMPKFKKLKVPIPPLSEQNRIVEILDKFDALVNDISVGLPAEIEARRKQYEYYRGKLLYFKRINNE